MAADPHGFGASWNVVQGQLTAEGANSTEVLAAQNAFADAFDSLSQQPGVQITGAGGVLQAAQQYVLSGMTIGGAVDQVGGLIQAAQSGLPPAQILEAFTGTMIGLTVATGVLTAGVGAAIVGAVTVLATILQGAGLFGGSPGTSIPGCSGTTFNPAPNWAIGCTAAYGKSTAPGTPSWRHFPSASNPNDAQWFTHGSSLTSLGVSNWNGLSISIPGYALETAAPIYTVFPLLAQVVGTGNFLQQAEYNALPVAVQSFHQSFIAAWKLNQEYALNGLNVQPDWAVLVHALRLWNRAHQPGTPYALEDSGVLYESTLIGDVASNLQSSDPLWAPGQSGTALVVNTGPQLNFSASGGVVGGVRGWPTKVHGPSDTSSTASTAATVAYGAAAVAGAGLLGAFLYARHKKTTTKAVLKTAWSKTGGKIHVPHHLPKLLGRKSR